MSHGSASEYGPGSRQPGHAGPAWVDEGALIDAGSDCNVSFFDPLLSGWGLVTRGTRTAGVQGPEYRVDTYTAIRLYTAAGGQLLGEDRSVGTLAPGAFADGVGFRADLLDCPVDDLPTQQPALTLVGGRPVHDPDGLLGGSGSGRRYMALYQAGEAGDPRRGLGLHGGTDLRP